MKLPIRLIFMTLTLSSIAFPAFANEGYLFGRRRGNPVETIVNLSAADSVGVKIKFNKETLLLGNAHPNQYYHDSESRCSIFIFRNDGRTAPGILTPTDDWTITAVSTALPDAPVSIEPSIHLINSAASVTLSITRDQLPGDENGPCDLAKFWEKLGAEHQAIDRM